MKLVNLDTIYAPVRSFLNVMRVCVDDFSPSVAWYWQQGQRWAVLVAVWMVTAVALYRGWQVVYVAAADNVLAEPLPTQRRGSPGLVPLMMGVPYGEWYEEETGYAPNDVYFGAYAILPQNDNLYIGWGTARPAEEDGALLAHTDGSTVTTVYTLTEQGFIDMTWFNDALYVPGVDPCCPDGWLWGNIYVYTPSTGIVKYRNLPNVIHTWGLWADPVKDRLLVATSSHLGDFIARTGEVFSTTNASVGWTRVATATDGVGDNRTYDIIAFNDQLYVTWNDSVQVGCGLAVQAGDGSWSRLPETNNLTACRPRLLVFGERLLALSEDRDSFVTVNTSGTVQTVTLPHFTVQDWAYNYGVVDEVGDLYVVATDGRVMRSSDLVRWEMVVATDRTLVTMAYWPFSNWLVVADRGRDMGIWRLDLATAVPLTAPRVPTVTGMVSGTMLLLDWPDVTVDEQGNPLVISGYRVYESDYPYFDAVAPTYLIGEPMASSYMQTLPSSFRFYRVRAQTAEQVLSRSSQTQGVYSFLIQVN